MWNERNCKGCFGWSLRYASVSLATDFNGLCSTCVSMTSNSNTWTAVLRLKSVDNRVGQTAISSVTSPSSDGFEKDDDSGLSCVTPLVFQLDTSGSGQVGVSMERTGSFGERNASTSATLTLTPSASTASAVEEVPGCAVDICGVTVFAVVFMVGLLALFVCCTVSWKSGIHVGTSLIRSSSGSSRNAIRVGWVIDSVALGVGFDALS